MVWIILTWCLGFYEVVIAGEMLEGNKTQTFKGMSCPSDDYAVHFLDQKRQKKTPRWSNCHS